MVWLGQSASLWCAQLLLGYLPPDVRQWEECLRSKRSDYDRFCRVHIT